MKRSKIIKMLSKNLIRQNDRLLEERREERQIALDRQLIAEDDRRSRIDRMIFLLLNFAYGIADGWLHVPSRETARSARSAVDNLADQARDADLAVDLLTLLQTISKTQQDQMETILNNEQKIALQQLAKKSADRVSANAEFDRAERDRRASTDPIGVGDVVRYGVEGAEMVVIAVEGDDATCYWKSASDDEGTRRKVPLSTLVLVRRASSCRD